MGTRRDRAARAATIAFDAISIEGGLLTTEWLAKVAQLDADSQKEADYRVPKGLSLRDEIGRYWRIAQAHWGELAAGRRAGADPAALAERFTRSLLRDAFGFESIVTSESTSLGGRTWPIRLSALGARVPIALAPVGIGLDAPLPELGEEGGRRRSAFGLLQEALNRADEALFGLATDGLRLRLARDNASLTRPAWIEADLERIFENDLYPNFAALWLLVHETRFGSADRPVEDCALERWREAGREEGARAREKLRAGFEKALVVLGQGFLGHHSNAELRSALHGGRLSKEAYFGELLRLVYRLIFLLAIEERDLLHPRGSSNSARELYEGGYALRRLRDRAVRRSGHDRHGDLYEATKIVFRGLAEGEPRLGLPALGGLFGTGQCPNLDAARIANRDLLTALFHLGWLRQRAGLVRVNWRDMGSEELGYVYEGLLELVPQITEEGRSFRFAKGAEGRGHARKTTGSYYTPDELVQVLLDSALEPVVERAIASSPDRPDEALLELAIVDPACGSGHFLIAAARRLAAHVARLRSDGTPSGDENRRAVREVVRRSIFGVDLNPLAVELCKVGLWMEAVEPGQPLSFLEAHVRHGNSLLGTTRELMGDDVPDEAWVALDGDDKAVARSLKKRNKDEREGQAHFPWGSGEPAADLRGAMEELEAAPELDREALADKERRWAELLASEGYRREKLVADAWCAAFLWPKEVRGPVADAAPTTAVWRELRAGPERPPRALLETTAEIADEYALFHWELAFPQVFGRGGFDVVLGNPPWERIKLQEKEYFARRHPEIAGARNAASRKNLIANLLEVDPGAWAQWRAASRAAQGASHFVRRSGRYPLCGKGDVNTYALFAEHNGQAIRSRGRAGFVVQSGIATDDTTKEYFRSLVDDRRLASFLSFENEEFVFRDVHHAFRFALLTLDGAGSTDRADLVFFARRVAELEDPDRHFHLAREEFALLNPNTHTCPTFRSRRDAAINLAIYERAGVLWREDDVEGNPWGLRFFAMLHMANDSGLFRERSELSSAGWRLEGNRFLKEGQEMLPLYEAKMVRHFDHRFGTYEGQTEAQARQGKLPELDDAAHADPSRVTLPRYWVNRGIVEERLDGRWDRGWMLGWRDVCRSTDRRTVIGCVIPRAAVNDKFLLMHPSTEEVTIACLYGNLLSIPFDYCARQKVGGISLRYFTMRQLPALSPSTFEPPARWDIAQSTRDWLLPRILELTYTSWDLQPFAQDCGDDGPPYLWDADRRFHLRCELDAAFFHLYGLPREDAAHILDSFPVVRRNEERAFGEFRTKRLVLEIYDALALAAKTGRPYATPLGPPKRAD